MVRYLILLLIAVIFLSCKKKNESILFKGIVSDCISSKPLSNVDIILYSTGIQSGVYNVNYTEKARSKTNNQGLYEISYEKDNSVNYKFFIVADNYINYENEFNIEDIENNVKTIDFQLNPKAWLDINVKNNIPFNRDDKITYNFKNINYTCSSCCRSNTVIGEGMIYIDNYYCVASGGKYQKVAYSVLKNKLELHYIDSVYCEPFDTTVFNIYY